VKKPTTSKKQATKTADEVTLTHPDRQLYPGSSITKRDLADYYAKVAPLMLAQIAERPISLVRCPAGEGKPCFFQRQSTLNGLRVRKRTARSRLPCAARRQAFSRAPRGLRRRQGFRSLRKNGLLRCAFGGRAPDQFPVPRRAMNVEAAKEFLPAINCFALADQRNGVGTTGCTDHHRSKSELERDHLRILEERQSSRRVSLTLRPLRVRSMQIPI
jgi:hypothetical protein